MEGITFTGDQLVALAMPLGGIGTGTIALAGDGSLRQWQIVNNVHHLAHVPSSFFFMQVLDDAGKSRDFKLLEKNIELPEGYKTVPSVNDHIIPKDVKHRHQLYPCVEDLEFTGDYPFATIRFLDDRLPVDISMTAWNPMIPLDVKNSSIPVILFTFTVTNKSGEDPVRLRLGGTMLNFIGWDGVSKIDLNYYQHFLSNKNIPIALDNVTGINLCSENPLISNHVNGDVFFGTIGSKSIAIPVLAFTNDFPEALNDPELTSKTFDTTVLSPHGSTWLGAVVQELSLEPSGQQQVTFVLTWYFPNRIVNYDRGLHDKVIPGDKRKTEFYLGDLYGTWYSNAVNVACYIAENLPMLETKTRAFHDALYDTTLPDALKFSVAATSSFLRSPSCFITASGEFHGFEGCNGASTGGGHGGCCPMDCTHVWNYVLTVARLFPELEVSMRNSEFARIDPNGALPHRMILPSYLPQLWNVAIGGPSFPALDGQLGCILKTYREYLTNGDETWLGSAYPRIKELLRHVFENYDPYMQGVITDAQGTTYDIEFFGKNTFIGFLYLAALKVGELLSNKYGEQEFSASCKTRFDKGQEAYDALWNGEYWIQEYDAEKIARNQYGTGCLSDQLFGQWWAYVLGFDEMMPAEHIDAALDSIVKYNLREDFSGFEQKPRVYAMENERALLVATWPRGDKPEFPVIYGDEAGWTGIEYELASLLIKRGKLDAAMDIVNAVRNRYDGRFRSPWNEVECGDHYVRAMSSWSMYEFGTGFRWNAPTKCLELVPAFSENPFTAFFITDSAWGTATKQETGETVSFSISSRHGTLHLERVVVSTSIGVERLAPGIASMAGKTIGFKLTSMSQPPDRIEISFEKPVILDEGKTLSVSIAGKKSK
ncbi:MAG TPA: GH116 family glycosyl-hydrolase [Candidatus Lokiarchaeia archaeon]|nr:GH116 family glycosyl-hydrolase [Candidatus Lokiarchaeia archaeon]